MSQTLSFLFACPSVPDPQWLSSGLRLVSVCCHRWETPGQHHEWNCTDPITLWMCVVWWELRWVKLYNHPLNVCDHRGMFFLNIHCLSSRAAVAMVANCVYLQLFAPSSSAVSWSCTQLQGYPQFPPSLLAQEQCQLWSEYLSCPHQHCNKTIITFNILLVAMKELIGLSLGLNIHSL